MKTASITVYILREDGLLLEQSTHAHTGFENDCREWIQAALANAKRCGRCIIVHPFRPANADEILVAEWTLANTR